VAAKTPGTATGMHAVLDRLPETYWRYVARHQLFRCLWERHRAPQPRYVVLDVGCGPGGLLAYLAAHAPVVPIGLDLVPDALAYCRRRGLSALGVADAIALPVRPASVDLVIAQDVVEHVADDTALLAGLGQTCRPGGLALIVAPARQGLWSTRDVRLGHHRRYTLERLAGSVAAAGFDVLHRTYLDLFLVPLLGIAVSLAPRTAEGVPDLPFEAPGGSGLVNQLLLAVSRLEAAVALRTPLPLGVAALVLGRRPP
jgi:SAM-dependent methyltransferase